MLININPCIVFIEDKYINMENVRAFEVNKDQLFVLLDYCSGDKDLLKFATVQELNRAINKLEVAVKALDYGC